MVENTGSPFIRFAKNRRATSDMTARAEVVDGGIHDRGIVAERGGDRRSYAKAPAKMLTNCYDNLVFLRKRRLAALV